MALLVGFGVDRWGSSITDRQRGVARLYGYSDWGAFEQAGGAARLWQRTVSLILEASPFGSTPPGDDAPPPRWRNRRLLTALAGCVALALAFLAIGTEGTIFSELRDKTTALLEDSPSEAAVDIENLSAIRTGMDVTQLDTLLGESFSRRLVPANPFGIVTRAVYYKPGRYVVIVFLTKIDTVVVYGVTALDPDYAVPIAGSESTRLGASTLREIGCADFFAGRAGASWANLTLFCGGAAAQLSRYVFVSWNPYSQVGDEGLAINAFEARLPEEVGNVEAQRVCRQALLPSTFDVPLEPSTLELAKDSCEVPQIWGPNYTRRFFASSQWRTALQRAKVNTFAVTAPNLVDGRLLNLFFHVMNGPGPCRTELDAGGGACTGWW
jgi:hypothetical protein